eukprot:gnl/TRDRNA2_/TRDRNA2_168682_c0_seq3.p1 gnl/TRDRNA2_/TRDRNA2_168682_c0~~gnl/TRDRNA2_/TRDRNA2_168682_c0_seq3.p1  ORF type:complete len:417 (+),score=80.08 gnl/TRDRNA2_/TRDRNA2_168682_c0_seq3:47-1252(+)
MAADLHRFVQLEDCTLDERPPRQRQVRALCCGVLIAGLVLVLYGSVRGSEESDIENLAVISRGGISSLGFAPRMIQPAARHGQQSGYHRPQQVKWSPQQHEVQAAARPRCTRCRSEGGESAAAAAAEVSESTVEEPRDDDVLPDSLGDCVRRSAATTADAIKEGVGRGVVEVFPPDLFDPLSGPVFASEADQDKYWRMSKIFCQTLAEKTGAKMRVIYPDVGVASMLKQQWQDVDFSFSSLNDRTPYDESEDEIIVIANADPPGLKGVLTIARQVEGTIPVILFNARLASGDVGIGSTVRAMRNEFMTTFANLYGFFPFDGGVTFKQYPEMWKVFVADVATPGRFKLISESDDKPSVEELGEILSAYSRDPSGENPNAPIDPLEAVAGFMGGMKRFIDAAR